MTRTKNNTGRTIYDLIVDYPKFSIPIIGFLLLLIAYFVIFKLTDVSFSDGKLAINTKKNDTIFVERRIYVNQIDTVFINKKKDRKTDNSKYSIDNTNSGEIKNQYIISENKGLIGDNNTINVNNQEIQRHLDPEGIKEMTSLINELTIKNKLKKEPPIYVRAAYDSEESINFANEIFKYLKQNNFNVISNEFEIFAPPINQTRLIVKGDSSIHIQVGYIK